MNADPTPRVRQARSWHFDRRLSHIPGSDGWPIVGSTFAFLADQTGWPVRMAERYGPVHRINTFLRRSVTVVDPDVADRILKDRDRLFSSEHGWANIVGLFFPRGLMLRDFDVHRLHRGILQDAFKKSVLSGYLDLMTPRIAREIAQWGGPGFEPLYPRLKRLTLDLAGIVFMGVEPGEELDRLSAAFSAMMTGTFALLRVPVPGTSFRRAAQARRMLEDWVSKRIPERRTSQGADLFSQLCRATDDEGRQLSDQEIVDHLIFLLLAAHDTTTSALTNLVGEIAASPVWQERLRSQLVAVGDTLTWDALGALGDIDLALKETLRLHPPVSAIPRLALRECELGGYRIPEHTAVWIDAAQIHRLPKFWTDPSRFDPDRFTDARAEHKRHPAIYLAYSAGPHVCLGIHFSAVQIKAVLHALLTRYRVELPAGYAPKRQLIPFPKPTDDLPVRLVPLGRS